MRYMTCRRTGISFTSAVNTRLTNVGFYTDKLIVIILHLLTAKVPKTGIEYRMCRFPQQGNWRW